MLFKEVKEMSLEDYLEDSGQLCWSCQKACGDCPWSELDPATKRPRFEPVPGWTAKPIRRSFGNGKKGPVVMDTYRITECPLYVPDEPMRIPRKGSAY